MGVALLRLLGINGGREKWSYVLGRFKAACFVLLSLMSVRKHVAGVDKRPKEPGSRTSPNPPVQSSLPAIQSGPGMTSTRHSHDKVSTTSPENFRAAIGSEKLSSNRQGNHAYSGSSGSYSSRGPQERRSSSLHRQRNASPGTGARRRSGSVERIKDSHKSTNMSSMSSFGGPPKSILNPRSALAEAKTSQAGRIKGGGCANSKTSDVRSEQTLKDMYRPSLNRGTDQGGITVTAGSTEREPQHVAIYPTTTHQPRRLPQTPEHGNSHLTHKHYTGGPSTYGSNPTTSAAARLNPTPVLPNAPNSSHPNPSHSGRNRPSPSPGTRVPPAFAPPRLGQVYPLSLSTAEKDSSLLPSWSSSYSSITGSTPQARSGSPSHRHHTLDITTPRPTAGTGLTAATTNHSCDPTSALHKTSSPRSPSSAVSPPYSSSSYSSSHSSSYSSATSSMNTGSSSTRRITSPATSTGSVGVKGLANLGNTCFMNCTLQCLSHTPKMLEVFKDNGSLTFCKTSIMKGNLAKAYGELLRDMSRAGDPHSVSPHHFKAQIQKYAKRFMGYEQQDCQEFLRFLLSGLHEDLNQPVEYSGDVRDTDSDEKKAEHSWSKYLSYECSIISDLFMGQLKSTLSCRKCKHSSVTFDPFWDLSLPMKRARTSTDPVRLIDCLADFTTEERLKGPEQAYCEKCEGLQDADKKLSIQRLPKVLVLHLKRFASQRFRTKLETPVRILPTLDMSPYLVNASDQPYKYSLYGIANHSGTAFGGHYTALCKHSTTGGDWHSFSDSRVSPSSAPTLTSSQAYVLFYSKCTH